MLGVIPENSNKTVLPSIWTTRLASRSVTDVNADPDQEPAARGQQQYLGNPGCWGLGGISSAKDMLTATVTMRRGSHSLRLKHARKERTE